VVHVVAHEIGHLVLLVGGVFAIYLHGFGRFNLQNTSCRGGTRCRGSADDLGRMEENGWGDREAEGVGGREVDDQLERGGLLHGEIRGLGAFQDLVDIGSGLAEEVGLARPIGHALRVQGWIGDLALAIEAELFGEEALKLRLRQQYGAQFNGFAVEEQLGRLREQLLPLFERVNRQLLQHLQTLQRPRPGSSPMVAIGRAGHVNVAQQQVHLQRRASNASPPVDP
jgi:hypothetical protein